MQDINDNDRDPIAGLLRRAGRRPQPSAEAAARIRAQVHAEWAAGVAQRKRQRWMALAASVGVLALAGVLALGLRGHGAPDLVAQVAATDRGVAVGERIEAAADRGLVLHTGAPGDPGAEVRLAAGSALRFEAAGQVRLLAGSLYVDTHQSGGSDHARLVVLADRASIEHIGTQFQVRRADGTVDVAVRSGSVKVTAAAASATLQRGELGRLHEDAQGGQSIERLLVSASGEPWAWVDGLSPPLAIDGLSLYDALSQLAREAGLDLKLASPEVELAAHQTVLHGPALDLPPAAALQAVLVTTSLAAEPGPDSSTLLIQAR